MTVALERGRFTVDEYHRMGEVGILTEDDRVEPIDGGIVEMSPIGFRHVRCVMSLNDVFVRRLEGRAVVSPEDSLRLRRPTEPQPDAILLRPRSTATRATLPNRETRCSSSRSPTRPRPRSAGEAAVLCRRRPVRGLDRRPGRDVPGAGGDL
jgi:hypothetical protein